MYVYDGNKITIFEVSHMLSQVFFTLISTKKYIHGEYLHKKKSENEWI